MKKLLPVILSILCTSSAYADYLDVHGILRSSDGTVKKLNYYDAMRACPKGTRVPTIREAGKLAQELGNASKILETSEVNPADVPEWYYLVSSRNYLKNDFFYFKTAGVNKNSDTGFFWSSSLRSERSNRYNISSHAYLIVHFDPTDSAIAFTDFGFLAGVRCIAKK